MAPVAGTQSTLRVVALAPDPVILVGAVCPNNIAGENDSTAKKTKRRSFFIKGELEGTYFYFMKQFANSITRISQNTKTKPAKLTSIRKPCINLMLILKICTRSFTQQYTTVSWRINPIKKLKEELLLHVQTSNR
ncbi:hypothetical protein BEL04_01545 [Mucilaginibacter sp. PPCGB 2223]|nr:hypothetical protein BEL04_01545 [Mucilaginibacter sp. PPCGB 2223]